MADEEPGGTLVQASPLHLPAPAQHAVSVSVSLPRVSHSNTHSMPLRQPSSCQDAEPPAPPLTSSALANGLQSAPTAAGLQSPVHNSHASDEARCLLGPGSTGEVSTVKNGNHSPAIQTPERG